MPIQAPQTGFFKRLVAPILRGRKLERPREPLFPPDFLAQLERLRFAALKAMGGGLREGHRLGAYKGGQLEFHGHRDYSPGDELRYVDWNSYARLGRPYVKEFAREESGVLHLLLDGTASMRLGNVSKFDFARRIGALFSHVALSSQDAVHAACFKISADAEFFPKRQARATVREFLAFFERLQADASNAFETQNPNVRSAAQEPSLSAWAAAFLKRAPHRGGVILISDFWQEEQDIAAGVSLLARSGFDLFAIHTLAAEELEPPPQGEISARSIENGSHVPLWFGPQTAALYRAELEKHRASVESIFRRRGGQYLFARSDTPLEKVLLATLRQRRWLI